MGENSKKSGELGETMATALLKRIGWKSLMQNVSIDCTTTRHTNEAGNSRTTHGEDQIFIYHSPFHDDRTDIVHISNKNHLAEYPNGASLKTKFKSHLLELYETIECAQYSPVVNELYSTVGSKKNRFHAGLLIWFCNSQSDLEKDIRPELSNIRIETDRLEPIYIIDNARASFLLKIVEDLKQRAEGGKFEFYYPRIGTATTTTVDVNRRGETLPLELIASDIVPAIIEKDNRSQIILYANENYESSSYKKLIAYGLNFASGLVREIYIGLPDYSPAQHQNDAAKVRMAFNERKEEIIPFCFNRSILSLLVSQE